MRFSVKRFCKAPQHWRRLKRRHSSAEINAEIWLLSISVLLRGHFCPKRFLNHLSFLSNRPLLDDLDGRTHVRPTVKSRHKTIEELE
ncbi:hypothetical protein JTE90_019235 [Oedothorax gibbosus]|uniref:Uncharacterized protein n=1 Tax=Oedothorax gibbosus TaxID=931172 RepID=A0AAV6UU17_9ARAC|nr:hypothetical protein JTE90_019235 [Oedothorax gibbosus]